MQIRLLKDLITELAGEGTEPIVDILYNKKDVNEFLIAKKMDLTINQIRNILYKLSAVGLVSFIRKKDKKKGWYIYYWTLDTLKSMVQIEEKLKRDINELKERLHLREVGRFYLCKSCNIEVQEEVALEHDFMCEECADVYELSDNIPYIRDIKGKITRKEKECDLLKEEVNLLKSKKAKSIARKNILEATKKEVERKAARALTAKKKAVKKPVKKAVKKAVKKPVKKAVKKAVKKPVKKAVKKAVKKNN